MYTKEAIRTLLETNDRAVARGVVAIYRYQTEAEQATQTTRDANGVGFNGVDAEILSSFALWINGGRPLTPKMLALARKKMMKYAGQLARIANGEV
jgi:hypothetical protein